MTIRKLICSLLLVTVLLGTTSPLVSASDVDSSSTAVMTSDSSSTEPSSSSSSTDVSFNSPTSSSNFSSQEEQVEENLPPRSERTLPPSGIRESIIGQDNQFHVLDTTMNPYRKVVHLEMVFPSNSARGSGVMIGPDLILTAAHNVYDSDTKEWASFVTATPAKNGSTRPYGRYFVSRYYVLRSYRTSDGDFNHDMAVLKLSRSVDAAVGSLPVVSTAQVGNRVQVPGYPGDTTEKKEKMYAMFENIAFLEDNVMYYKVDTESGQSGAPVLNAYNEVVGIHVLGDSQYNGARRVMADSLRMIEVARNNRPANEEVIVYPEEKTGNTYRLYHPGIRRHLYTQNLDEANVLKGRGWSFEGLKFKTATTGTPVYRLYHSGTREHIYTTSTNERDVLSKRGWRYEGVAWYSSGKKPVYRLYHAGLKIHLYTTDENEKNTLVKREWKYEGVSFYTLQ